MRLLECYALATGLKIGKQHLLERFFPLPFTRYMILHASSGMQGKNYPFYGLVVDLIKPYLTKAGIEIVQMGTDKDPAIQGCYHIMGKDNVHQASYLIRNALLHLGNDSIWGHRAGHLGIPLVQPWGPTDPACHSSLEHDPEKTAFLVSHRGGRHATFAAQENPMSIALVDPHDVARAVLRLLKIEHTITQRALSVGPAYNAQMLELIPNIVPAPEFNPQIAMAVRMDLEHNESILMQTLHTGRKVNIVTKAPINLQLLAHFKDSIITYNHEVDEKTPLDYIRSVKKLIKQPTFFSRVKDEAKLAQIRFIFFDVSYIEQVVDKTRDDVEKMIREYTNQPDFQLDSALKSGKMRFRSQKYVLSKAKMFLSLAHANADVALDTPNGNEIIMTDDWVKDINHFLVYET